MRKKLYDIFIEFCFILFIASSFFNLASYVLINKTIKEYKSDEIRTLYYTDMDTCVLYLTNKRGVSIMLDKNSKVMLDQECLLSKEGVDE